MAYTYETSGPRCPYCDHLHRADDPFYYDEDVTEMECDHCGRMFDVEISHSTSWTCEKKDTPR